MFTMRLALFSGLVLLSGCQAFPESQKPVEIKPGLYEITQMAGRGNFEAFNFCVKPSYVADWPHDLTKELIHNDHIYPDNCEMSVDKREGNLATTVHACRDSDNSVDTMDIEWRFKSVIAADSVNVDRTFELTFRPGISEDDKKEWQDEIDKSPDWGTDMFTAVRKSDC
jgi:hypothetical protein